MMLITDAHVNTAAGTHRPFFRMLDALGKTSEDIVFMGDIFDLWIALPGYEEAAHTRFLSWCREQKAGRKIGYIEGNHEFFLAEEKADAFSWATARAVLADGRGNLFCHGDCINRRDRNYLRFRELTKNRAVKQILRILPSGPFWAETIKKKLRHTNQAFRSALPREEILRFLSAARALGLKRIFVGHFHQEVFFRCGDTHLHILPDWMTTRRITRFNRRTGQVSHFRWEALDRHPPLPRKMG
ncbi:UDP-2,3-diacylglucosamine diphosphatase [Desulfococcus sp.]|uniref:UDP-2,3-diacylglucosamine diphosphatase n=1 Tax=Desulfococcus sp. TaxID=2025834 RepID=UPI003593AF9E